MRLYVVFGEYTDRLAEHLAGSYEIAGQDRTLEAAVAAMGNLSPDAFPDVFLVLGKALASGMVDGHVNHGAALVAQLQKLRRACPRSRVIVILSASADDSLVHSIAKLGIYDIHRVDSVSVDDLRSFIENPKSYADYDIEVKAKGTPGEVVVRNAPVEKEDRPGLRESLRDRMRLLIPPKRPDDHPETASKAGSKPETPKTSRKLGEGIFHRLRGERLNGPHVLTPDSLVSVEDPREVNAEAVFIPASWKPSDVKSLRRDIKYIPLIVVGATSKEYLQAGADRCVKRITDDLLEEVRQMSKRLNELWSRAETDALTGCYMRRFWDEWISEQMKLKRPFSVAILDIDHFKKVNDTYGHQAGDNVLAAFGEFLRSHVRGYDIVARYGGEEFAVGLPHTGKAGAAALIDRLRIAWPEHRIGLAGGKELQCTFSAGVAEWPGSKDPVAEADRMLYQAKEEGRNRVKVEKGASEKVLLLGSQAQKLAPELRARGFSVTGDPADAGYVLTDYESFRYAPPGLKTVVLGTGTVADFMIKRARPDAVLCSEENAVDALTALIKGEPFEPAKTKGNDRPKLAVLPGIKRPDGQTLPKHAALYIVCPSRPSFAGETAANLAREISGCALVCAAPESTAALALGLTPQDLVMADWRVPGSLAPVDCEGIKVWPVDPLKFLDARESAHGLVERIKSAFDLVLVDCGGSLDLCARVLRTDGIIVIQTAGDLADQATEHWLKVYAGPNVIVARPAETPQVVPADNGFMLLARGAAQARR